MREKKFRETELIAATIGKLPTPGMKPKALIEAVRQVHPAASKKDIARAAFLTVILSAEFDPDDTQALHDLAVSTQDEAGAEELDTAAGRRRPAVVLMLNQTT